MTESDYWDDHTDEDAVRVTESHMDRGTRTIHLAPGESFRFVAGFHMVEVAVAPFDADDPSDTDTAEDG